MIAAIYVRKSTSQVGRDAEDKSVARQIDDARTFAAAKGWTVADEHVYSDDAVSGAEILRLVAKQRMLDLIRSGEAPFQALVMQSNDRLSRRDGDEAFGELKSIARAGIEVWFYSDGRQFTYGDFASNTLGFLNGEVAAEFRRVIAKKTREAMRRKAERGHVTGGRVFGYDNVRLNSHVERRINEAEADVAVLCAPDGQASEELDRAWDDYHALVDHVVPFPIGPRPMTATPGLVLSKQGEWVHCNVAPLGSRGSLTVTDAEIARGMSGSPIIVGSEAVGVLGLGGGQNPQACLVSHLPGWLASRQQQQTGDHR